MNKDGEFEYTLASGESVTVFYEAEYTLVDNGIGHYEFWGARGRDVQLDTECEDATVTTVENEAGEDIYDTLSDDERKALKQAAYDHANDHCPSVDEYESDYEDNRPERDDYPEYD